MTAGMVVSNPTRTKDELFDPVETKTRTTRGVDVAFDHGQRVALIGCARVIGRSTTWRRRGFLSSRVSAHLFLTDTSFNLSHTQ